MRLICPNCDAEYEVDPALIPDSGRDVQCSDCGHVWFQVPENAVLPDEDIAEVVSGLVATPAPTPEPFAEPTPGAREDEPAPMAADVPQPPARPALDESLLAILREEAERETQARAQEDARARMRSLEMQPDLGLPEAEPAPRLRVRPRAAVSSYEVDDAAPDADFDKDATQPGKAEPAPTPRSARRELLPDIDRINSTLEASGTGRAAGNGQPIPAAPEPRRRGAFRTGFVLVVLVAILGWTIYAQAPAMTRAVPQAEPMITAWVDQVDRLRFGLDELVRGLLGAM